MKRGLFEVQPEAELAWVARARACREGGGMELQIAGKRRCPCGGGDIRHPSKSNPSCAFEQWWWTLGRISKSCGGAARFEAKSMGKETTRSPEKRWEGDMKLTIGSWRALFYITTTQVLYFAALGVFLDCRI